MPPFCPAQEAAAPSTTAAAAAAAAPSVRDPVELQVAERLPPLPSQFQPLPPLPQPAYQELRLRNGLRVYLVEDHEVPAVRGSLLMRGGMRASPPDKVRLPVLGVPAALHAECGAPSAGRRVQAEGRSRGGAG